MDTKNTPLVHLEDWQLQAVEEKQFASLRRTYCGRWFPMKSEALASWAPLGGIMCEECLRLQLRRDREAGPFYT